MVGEDLVGGPVAAAWLRGGWGQSASGVLDGHVGVDVLLVLSGVGMSEPEGDDGAVDAGLQQRHRAAVAEPRWGARACRAVMGSAARRLAAWVAAAARSTAPRVQAAALCGWGNRRILWQPGLRSSSQTASTACVAVFAEREPRAALRPLPSTRTCAAGPELECRRLFDRGISSETRQAGVQAPEREHPRAGRVVRPSGFSGAASIQGRQISSAVRKVTHPSVRIALAGMLQQPG
jgi:hypothetical protein